MARFTKAQREEKIEQARNMYCKGFDVQTIADTMGDVEVITVERWARDNDFEKSKRSRVIALSAIRDSILESYAEMLDGKKPKVSPDAAAKYATAFEKFSSKKQVLTYMHEAYEMLCEEFMKDIQTAQTRKDKEILLSSLQGVRTMMNKVLTRLTNEVLGNE